MKTSSSHPYRTVRAAADPCASLSCVHVAEPVRVAEPCALLNEAMRVFGRVYWCIHKRSRKVLCALRFVRSMPTSLAVSLRLREIGHAPT